MLKGPEFGAAIAAAMQKKIDTGKVRSQADIARHFGVKPPSLADWVKRGTVSKTRLPALWKYFADVVGPEHWGMTAAEWPAGLTGENPTTETEAPKEDWPYPKIDETKIRCVTGTNAARLEGAILLAAAQLGLDVRKDG